MSKVKKIKNDLEKLKDSVLYNKQDIESLSLKSDNQIKLYSIKLMISNFFNIII